MRVLMLAYPLEPVGPAACGGVEQLAYLLLRGLNAHARHLDGIAKPARQGDIVIDLIAARGSLVPARLEPAVEPRAGRSVGKVALTADALASLERDYNQSVLARLARGPSYSLIHIQGGPFHRAAAAVTTPVLFTLHLARSLYGRGFLDAPPPNVRLQCVSRTQYESYAASPRLRPRLAGWVANGIDLARFPARAAAPGGRAPLLYLGRICHEKGPHLAIELARRAGRRLWLAGDVYPLAAHRRYFRECIEPHLGPRVRWIQRPSAADKSALLRNCAAVVIPSLVEETSSLVAMEAAASGAPVLALRQGALAEVVAHAETGWLADDVDGLTEYLPRLAAIDPRACRARAERHFSAKRMVAEYAALYLRLADPRP